MYQPHHCSQRMKIPQSNTNTNNSVSDESHSTSESSQIQQRLSILEDSTISISSEILNAHSSIKNFEILLSKNLQGLRSDIVEDVMKLMNTVETSPESIETLKQVHARELKMLREKMHESDIDKKKIIENFETEKCQLLSKAKELERNSIQAIHVFHAAEEHLNHAKLQEKDATIEKLHDRLLTVKEDILGCQ
ncbi:unnamed protein product [Mytilus coruscus]|uniref:Uncharacterized protein n=1 Tax=Mytilus coruscus TaxID=42192 RepID=A0A6J8DQ06_MYTCO|nr:unnamed protein product [Mytilus coruscus]